MTFFDKDFLLSHLSMSGIKYYFFFFSILLFVNLAGSGQNDIIISEFMASNTSILQDEDGDFPDWIEIYNSDSVAIHLSGWFLTDNAGIPSKWAFPLKKENR